jgi:hypothetical protein
MTKPGPNATPAELRAYGDHVATLPEWGPEPPCWQVAMAQMDWYVEARIVEESIHQGLKDQGLEDFK